MPKNSPPAYSCPGTATTSTNIIVSSPTFGPHPQIVVCPSCHHQVTTRVQAEASTKTHLIAALLCLVSCCCIPYCMDSCKNQNHYCPSCNSYLGVYSN